MDVAESKTFRNFAIFNKAKLFLIKLNKKVVKPVSKNVQGFFKLCSNLFLFGTHLYKNWTKIN